MLIMFHLGIVTHQIRLKATLLQSYWKKYLVRNKLSHPGELIEVQSSNKKDSVLCLRTDLDKVNAQIHDLYEVIEMILECERLKGNVKKIGRN